MPGASLSVKLVSPCRGLSLAESTTPTARKHKMYCARDNASPILSLLKIHGRSQIWASEDVSWRNTGHRLGQRAGLVYTED